MDFNPLWLFLSAAGLALFSTVSLLVANEGIRGAGRILGGAAWCLVGVGGLLVASSGMVSECSFGYTLASIVALLSGLVTVGSGVRKFLRRDIGPSSSGAG